MSNNDKWKNKKIKISNYKVVNKKPKKQISLSWKKALTGLFLIAIPSFLIFLLLGKDGWLIPSTKNISRWGVELPIAITVSALQFLVVSLLIWKFKVFSPDVLNFLVPIILGMNSLLVSSGQENIDWYIRVLPAVGLSLTAVPIILINKAVVKSKNKKEQKQKLEEEKKYKSLLD